MVGSFQGVLRIYAPKQSEPRPEDLLLEQNLELPILQVEAGIFVPYACPHRSHVCVRRRECVGGCALCASQRRAPMQ